jgi:hypothetical protein
MKTCFKKSKILFSVSVLSVFVLIMSLSGCKKDAGNTPAPNTAPFPKNTEWVGTMDGSGFQYRPPCCLKFNNDNTFTMYGIFVSFQGNVQTIKDSLTGIIASTDTLPDGRIRITTDIRPNFNGGATKYLYITDKKKLQGFDAGLSFENFQLSLFPAEGISVGGTSWRGIAWKGGYAYPDVTTVSFDNSNPAIPVTHYTKNGSPVGEGADPKSPVLGVLYKQVGARVYFSGYNDDRNQFPPPAGYGGWTVPYFGVLLPSGDKMMVHSLNRYARLPGYVLTNEPYGQNGATPIIEKY